MKGVVLMRDEVMNTSVICFGIMVGWKTMVVGLVGRVVCGGG